MDLVPRVDIVAEVNYLDRYYEVRGYNQPPMANGLQGLEAEVSQALASDALGLAPPKSVKTLNKVVASPLVLHCVVQCRGDDAVFNRVLQKVCGCYVARLLEASAQAKLESRHEPRRDARFH